MRDRKRNQVTRRTSCTTGRRFKAAANSCDSPWNMQASRTRCRTRAADAGRRRRGARRFPTERGQASSAVRTAVLEDGRHGHRSDREHPSVSWQSSRARADR